MGRYNLWMLILYTFVAAGCYCAFALDPSENAMLSNSLLALGIDVTVQLPLYWLAFWWKRDRDVTNFIVTVVDIIKYFLSLVKHGLTFWVLAALIITPFSWHNVGTYVALVQLAQTAYSIIVPLCICVYMKLSFCCGATKLKPGQTQEEALMEYVKRKAGKP